MKTFFLKFLSRVLTRFSSTVSWNLYVFLSNVSFFSTRINDPNMIRTYYPGRKYTNALQFKMGPFLNNGSNKKYISVNVKLNQCNWLHWHWKSWKSGTTRHLNQWLLRKCFSKKFSNVIFTIFITTFLEYVLLVVNLS